MSMTLEKYLKEAYPELRMSAADAAFAADIGTFRQNITRYRTFVRYPSPAMAALIRDATKGLVTADDHMPPEFRAKSGRKATKRCA